ncbi:MAG: sugar phosphate isomerase/epimerase [Armatimonadetes bacterium]|nr:sugar phosphate isomerase/epimerase [Armatimonadota bacterium]
MSEVSEATGAAAAKPKIGAQLIIFGRRNAEDFPGVLQDVKAAGYDGFESGNLYARYSRGEVMDLLGSTGLEVCGAHSGFGDVADLDKVESAIEFLKGVGSRYLMVSGVGDLKRGLAAYDDAIEVFERAGRLCKSEGIDFCYHNHAWEFEPTDGKIPMHYLCDRTDPSLVKLCIDVYWVHVGGEDPATFIRRYADRAAYFHFKDGWKGTFTELGRGEVDLERLMPEVLGVMPEWIAVEQDRTDGDPAQSMEVSRTFLRERLGL